MSFFGNVNFVTAGLIVLFVIPILIGVISPFSSDRMQRSLSSLLNNLIFLAALFIAVYLTGWLLSDGNNPLLMKLYTVVPSLQALVASKDILVYIVAILLLAALTGALLYLVTMPVYTYIIVPLTEKFASAMRKMNGFFKHLLGGIWEVPKAVVIVVVVSLFLSFFISYYGDSALTRTISSSAAYQYVNKTILGPLLNSDLAKKIPVLLKDTFKDAAGSLEDRNIRLIRYFNGMTLPDAVKSNADIDDAAKKIIGKATEDKEKARLLYTWVAKNISYDNAKAAAVAKDPSSVSSGAIVAYNTRTGVCFDYACLYVAMCRAVDVKVRFVTGLGYSGIDWGDHAWNQAYDPSDGRWIDVDTTFGSSGRNYFDRADFDSDHQYAVIQGEW